jgi:hypothetical protein
MTRTTPQRVQKAHRRTTGGPVGFKYYIHDTSAGYSFEMSGPFTESVVAELECCWQTAKPTLNHRSLTLDLRGLTVVDEAAKQWLAAMHIEGAHHLPESFLRDTVAGIPGRPDEEPCKQSIFGRLASALRGAA